MDIFIAGGNRFFGTHLSKFFTSQDHDITIFDNLSNSNSILYVNKKTKVIEDVVVYCSTSIKQISNNLVFIPKILLRKGLE